MRVKVAGGCDLQSPELPLARRGARPDRSGLRLLRTRIRHSIRHRRASYLGPHRSGYIPPSDLLAKVEQDFPAKNKDGSYDLIVAFTAEGISRYFVAGRPRVDRIGNCSKGWAIMSLRQSTNYFVTRAHMPNRNSTSCFDPRNCAISSAPSTSRIVPRSCTKIWATELNSTPRTGASSRKTSLVHLPKTEARCHLVGILS